MSGTVWVGGLAGVAGVADEPGDPGSAGVAGVAEGCEPSGPLACDGPFPSSSHSCPGGVELGVVGAVVADGVAPDWPGVVQASPGAIARPRMVKGLDA